MESVDALIIGAGQAGEPLSIALGKAGWKVALVEKKYVGGTCINYGCTPTKTMVASAEIAYLSQHTADFGVNTRSLGVDIHKVRQRKDGIVEDFRNSGERRVKNAGVELIYGLAKFISPKTMEVSLNDGNKREISADKIMINAGARSQTPKITGMESVPYLDSTSIMELDELPEHLLIIGGGYIAVEFGQMFRRFGSQVTILQHSSQLLGREDADVAESVLKILQEDGIQVLLNTEPLSVEKLPGGKIGALVKSANGSQKLTASHLLAAVGRTPNSDLLGLAAAGVNVDVQGFIQTNDRLETNVSGIYALGDIKGGPAFTHISYDDYRILKTNLIDGGNASKQGRMVPYTVFIDPQLGRVGITEKEARKKWINILVNKMPMDYVARAIEMGRTRGFMKVVVDADLKQILGAAILGTEGGELMSMIEIAMLGKLPYTALRDAIFAHPTLAESLNNLFNL
jgi:pyruvate/2-oxoglutarate dehydrogenase complex dihydrolipoamide dehydrogenase (E3) component